MVSLWRQFDVEFQNVPGGDKTRLLNNHDESWMTNLNECNLCQGEIICDKGILACKNCHIIVHSYIDRSPEWRFYGNDEKYNKDPARCGMFLNSLLQESSYGCTIVSRSSLSYDMRRIKRNIEWLCMPYREKAQYDNFLHIQNVATHASLPKLIVNDAKRYYKLMSDEKTYRGANRESVLAASIYISCRVNSNPRSAKEISEIFNLTSKNATKGCKNAMNIMNCIDGKTNDTTHYCETTPTSFIARYCSKLRMNHEQTMLCEFIAKRIQQLKIMRENTPNSIAASIMYFVIRCCNINHGKCTINQMTGISEVTIIKCYKKLMTHYDELVPLVIRNKYKYY